MTPRMAFAVPLLALSAVFLPALSAHAQLYKWVDASGHVQYSDKPPTGVSAEPVKSHISSVQSGSAGHQETPADREQAFRKRQTDAQDAAKKQDAEAQHQQELREACANARSRVAAMEAGGRQVRFDANGERHYLDDDQISHEKERAQQDASKYCK